MHGRCLPIEHHDGLAARQRIGAHMRVLLVVILTLVSATHDAHASRPPLDDPCPDLEKQFVDRSLSVLVRHGYIDERNLITYSEPRSPGSIARKCQAVVPTQAERAPGTVET